MNFTGKMMGMLYCFTLIEYIKLMEPRDQDENKGKIL